MRELVSKSAISQVTSIAVVVLIAVAAFGGYAVSQATQRVTSIETTVETLTSTPPPETTTATQTSTTTAYNTLTSTESVTSTILTNSITQVITITQTSTITLTTSITKTTTITKTLTTNSSNSQQYYVVFQQIGACTPEFWGIPWSVTIGNLTLVQPPNTPIPINNGTLYGTTNLNYTTITFLLSNGVYSFRVSPTLFFFTPTTGTVTVSGSNVTVPIRYTGTSCTTSTKTSSSG